MLRQFQVSWHQPSTAAYAWFLGSTASTARLVVGARALQASATSIRQQTQGRANRPLWRPTLARFGRLGFVAVLASWLVTLNALIMFVCLEGRKLLTSLSLPCVHYFYLAEQARFARPVTRELAAAPRAAVALAARTTVSRGDHAWLAFTTLSITPPAPRHGPVCDIVVFSPLQGSGVGVWGLVSEGPQVSTRLTGLEFTYRSGSVGSFSLLCEERARLTRLLVAAWKRHLGSQRTANF
jgi:hypothetical protein